MNGEWWMERGEWMKRGRWRELVERGGWREINVEK
jgi:hypothetical protein